MNAKLTHEEMVDQIRIAVAKIPPLGKHDWQTIYQSLARERKRVREVFAGAEESLPEAPETNAFLSRLKGEIAHISKIMLAIGDSGRNMLIHADRKARLECAGVQKIERERECACADSSKGAEE